MDSTVEQVIYLLTALDYLHYHSRIDPVTSIFNLDWAVEEKNYSLSRKLLCINILCT
jgi:hypothetical protein